MEKKPQVTITMEAGGKMVLELEPEKAPNTVRNFIDLAESGFYDGLTFHRVIPGFMIQGGCPDGTGAGSPGYRIRGEFTANKHDNPIKHERGVISMARAQSNDSAGCQFFIVVENASHLDGQYAAFGRVIEGMETADQIVSAPTDPRDKPLEEQRINKVTVEKFGSTFEKPDTL